MGDWSHQELQPNLAAVLLELNQWPTLTNEAPEKLKMARADAVLQSALRDLTREEVDGQVLKVKTLPECLPARSAKILQVMVEQENLSDETGRSTLQGAAWDTVCKDLSLVTGGCESP